MDVIVVTAKVGGGSGSVGFLIVWCFFLCFCLGGVEGRGHARLGMGENEIFLSGLVAGGSLFSLPSGREQN